MTTRNAAATFDPLRPKLIRIVYRMLGSVADAEDMVQEAFLRAWRGRETYEGRVAQTMTTIKVPAQAQTRSQQPTRRRSNREP